MGLRTARYRGFSLFNSPAVGCALLVSLGKYAVFFIGCFCHGGFGAYCGDDGDGLEDDGFEGFVAASDGLHVQDDARAADARVEHQPSRRHAGQIRRAGFAGTYW